MRGNLRESDPQGFTNAALGPVPLNGAAEGARHSEAQPGTSALTLHSKAKRSKIRTSDANAGVVDVAELGRTKNAGAFGKAIANSRTVRLSRHSR